MACTPSAPNHHNDRQGGFTPSVATEDTEKERPEEVFPNAIRKVFALYLGDESAWPYNVNISPHGDIPQSACGPLEAAYCPLDRTIGISADLMLAWTKIAPGAIPFVVAHEIAHGRIMDTPSLAPHQNVLHELLADCLAGQMVARVFPDLTSHSSDQYVAMAGMLDSMGDNRWLHRDHHGFGPQRHIAFRIGVHAWEYQANQNRIVDCSNIFAATEWGGGKLYAPGTLPSTTGWVADTKATNAVCQVFDMGSEDLKDLCDGNIFVSAEHGDLIVFFGKGSGMLLRGEPFLPLYASTGRRDYPQVTRLNSVMLISESVRPELLQVHGQGSFCLIAATLIHQQMLLRCRAILKEGSSIDILIFVPELLAKITDAEFRQLTGRN